MAKQALVLCGRSPLDPACHLFEVGQSDRRWNEPAPGKSCSNGHAVGNFPEVRP